MRIEPLDNAEYLLVTTYKRDGTGVGTPVWFAGGNGRYVVVTEAQSGKVKRIKNIPRVEIAVCDRKGRVNPGAAALAATARMLDGNEADANAAVVQKKYGLKWKAFERTSGLWRKVRKSDEPEQAVIEITLTEAI
ncbi:MAG: PPOX class F420-dependent oxidoreductase [Acidimicrobiia bacterium]|nr:PPOX class F420-dependent oxidoreductase [Acidimicrobiia bacterium]